jgi:hypothetical protein
VPTITSVTISAVPSCLCSSGHKSGDDIDTKSFHTYYKIFTIAKKLTKSGIPDNMRRKYLHVMLINFNFEN